MRILFLVDIKGNLGDVIRVARMYKKLKDSGADMAVMNLQDFHRPRTKLLDEPWILAQLCWGALTHYQLGKYYVQAQLCRLILEKQLGHVKPDAIWCEGILLGGIMAPVCRKHSIPLVIDVHGLISAEYKENQFQSPTLARYEFLCDIERQAVEGSQVLITVSKPMREHFIHHGAKPEQLMCIPNGAELQSDQAIYQQPLKVIFGGAFVFWEDIDAFLDAGKLGQGHEFYLAGAGYLKDHLTRRIKDENIGIRYLGNIPRDRIMKVFSGMQVGIAPSTDGMTRRVACPIKVFDYLACGLPVITPDFGEWATVVKEHGCGFVTTDSDGAQFHHALEQFRNRHTWEEMSANAKRLIQNQWNWNQVLEPVPQILNRI